uniref:Photosystem I assembly protein Ycf4 n=1 Tax=Chloropicon maureeniae TaxID=1461542 RepID=A0A4D6C3E7_9CHLO|nr:hypothetical chloroplast RF4 [Chloropicon maureeniae]QBX98232.1 hypothetical chloroplast RF4 [Chloropicon maureeniae]
MSNMQFKKTVPIKGSRRFSNLLIGIIVFLGSFGFLLAGLFSYLGWLSSIVFFPQGLVMTFYGLVGLSLSIYLGLTMLWGVGEGFNEFDLENQKIRLFRYGFPGKSRSINLEFSLDEVESVKLEVEPRRTLYLRLKGKRQYPLTDEFEPSSLSKLEEEATELARFLKVPVEGLP